MSTPNRVLTCWTIFDFLLVLTTGASEVVTATEVGWMVTPVSLVSEWGLLTVGVSGPVPPTPTTTPVTATATGLVSGQEGIRRVVWIVRSKVAT